MATFDSVDAYIASFPADIQATLRTVEATIRDAVPGTEERISYGIPTFTLDGRYVVYFSAWKAHIAVYPVPEGDEALQRELAPYRAGKGTLRFPTNRPMPLDLIGRVARALMLERHEGRGSPATA
jgi:uncharacterized protein YdhG (YjbR/CyaY superfamily)